MSQDFVIMAGNPAGNVPFYSILSGVEKPTAVLFILKVDMIGKEELNGIHRLLHLLLGLHC